MQHHSIRAHNKHFIARKAVPDAVEVGRAGCNYDTPGGTVVVQDGAFGSDCINVIFGAAFRFFSEGLSIISQLVPS